MNGTSTVELLVRLVFSLGLIIGLLALAAKIARKNGGRLPGFAKKDSAIKVLDRQALTKTASLAVVQVGDRTMVVGVTEHGITMLADGPAPDALTLADRETASETGSEITADLTSSATSGPDATIDLTAALQGRGTTSASRGAKGTLPLGASFAVDTASGSRRSPRMSFFEALRELTVRKA